MVLLRHHCIDSKARLMLLNSDVSCLICLMGKIKGPTPKCCESVEHKSFRTISSTSQFYISYYYVMQKLEIKREKTDVLEFWNFKDEKDLRDQLGFATRFCCCCSIARLYSILSSLVDCSTPGSSVIHYLLCPPLNPVSSTIS